MHTRGEVAADDSPTAEPSRRSTHKEENSQYHARRSTAAAAQVHGWAEERLPTRGSSTASFLTHRGRQDCTVAGSSGQHSAVLADTRQGTLMRLLEMHLAASATWPSGQPLCRARTLGCTVLAGRVRDVLAVGTVVVCHRYSLVYHSTRQVTSAVRLEESGPALAAAVW